MEEVSFSHLQSMGHDSVDYVDYLHLEGDTCKLWLYYFMATIQTVRVRVYYTPREAVITKQTIICLGFAISSTKMTLSLTDERKARVKDCSKDILSCNRVTTRKFAKLKSNLVARFLQ